MNHRIHPLSGSRRGRQLALVLVAAASVPLAVGVAAQGADNAALDLDTPTLAQAQQPPPPQPAELTPAQLEQLAAPIALYPDGLVAQVLAASTYPAQVVEADRWLQANPNLKGEALGTAADQQPWDSGVKGLVQFPVVLAMMDRNLAWTSSLGEAYMNDPQAVMAAVQRLRQRAQQAGNLKSTPQQTVTTQGSDIAIEPAQPSVVFVPEFDPWAVYGAPIDFYPDWYFYPGLYWTDPGIYWGIGIGIGFFGGFGWGWGHWGCDWPGRGVWFNHAPYVSNSPTFWRGRGPGPAYRPGGGGFHPGSGFRPGSGFPGAGFARPPAGGSSRSGAFSGYGHGGVTRGYSTRGGSSFGGFHGGGGGGGGFHGGGGGFHGGGGRR